jgi:hypothetical protein
MEKNGSKVARDNQPPLMKTLLVILTAFLIFAGPTYIVFLLVEVLKINYAASMLLGFMLFIAGLSMFGYLVRKRIITL